MTLAVSTSSPLVSAALIGPGSEVLARASEVASGNASGALTRLVEACLRESRHTWADVSQVVADVGPGGFSGVRVGVTMAKTWAYALGVPAAGATAFDLVEPGAPVAVPVRKGEWFLRRPGCEPERVTDLAETGAVGYGPGREDSVWPEAFRAAPLLATLEFADPFLLVPRYLAEPSVSQPKKPYALGGAG